MVNPTKRRKTPWKQRTLPPSSALQPIHSRSFFQMTCLINLLALLKKHAPAETIRGTTGATRRPTWLIFLFERSGWEDEMLNTWKVVVSYAFRRLCFWGRSQGRLDGVGYCWKYFSRRAGRINETTERDSFSPGVWHFFFHEGQAREQDVVTNLYNTTYCKLLENSLML